jgi:hypothetical protein
LHFLEQADQPGEDFRNVVRLVIHQAHLPHDVMISNFETMQFPSLQLFRD